MAIPPAEYVETLLARAYPNADFIVASEPDGLYVEIYADSFTLHWAIADERSVFQAALEKFTDESEGTAP